MRRLLICLPLIAGCETEAAAPEPGFVALAALERTVAADVEEALERLPIETPEQPRLSFLPRTLVEAERLLEELEGEDLPPLGEACDTPDWFVFSLDPPESEQRFRRGWAVDRTTLAVYRFDYTQ